MQGGSFSPRVELFSPALYASFWIRWMVVVSISSLPVPAFENKGIVSDGAARQGVVPSMHVLRHPVIHPALEIVPQGNGGSLPDGPYVGTVPLGCRCGEADSNLKHP